MERATEIEERERLISELQKRNAELARFNYSVSHDLRNPLVTIRNFLGLLLEHLLQLFGRHVEVAEVVLELLGVYADRTRLLAMFRILLDNAVKYMGDQEKPRVELGVKRDEAETVIYVRDNGRGIDPRYHEKIFGLFDRLDTDVEGTGIGLALVKRIVETYRGRIWVESKGQGQGSTFCFTLPESRPR